MSIARRSLQIVAFLCTLLIGVTSMVVIVTQTAWFKEWLRGFIVRQAEDYVNGRLSIGRLDGNLFFGIELDDVDVTMNGKTVVDVGSLGLDYNAFTFIGGDVVLNSLKLTQPMLRLERTAQGWNLANLIKARTPDEPKSNRTIEVKEIGVSDGTLFIEDRAVGTSGVALPSKIERLDASVGVKSNASELAVDINHVSFRATDPEIGVNALSGIIRKTDTAIGFENVSLRTEESSLRIVGAVKGLDADTPVVGVSVSSDKLALREIGQLVPALKPYVVQPAFEVEASGPADAMTVKLNAREGSIGQLTGDLTVDAVEPNRRVAGTISLNHVNLAPLVPPSSDAKTATAAKSTSLESDITGQARFDMALPSENLPLSGTFAVRAERAKIAGYEARDIVADGRVDDRTVRIDRGSAAAYGGRATVRGTVKTGQPLVLNLSGSATGLDLRNLPPQLDAPGVASDLNLESFTVTGRGSVFSGDVRLGMSTLAGATIAQGSTASFTVGTGAPSYAAKGQIAGLDLQQIGQGFNITALNAERYRSRINATFDVKGSGGGRYPLTVDATGMVRESEMFGANIPRLDFTTNLANGDAHVKAAGEFANLDPGAVSGDMRVAGNVRGELDVDATVRQYADGVQPDDVDASGRIALGTSTIGGLSIDTATLDGRFANREGVIDELTVTGRDLTVTGQGPLALNETGTSNLQLHVDAPSLATLGALAGQDNLSGGANVDATINGNGQTLLAWGTVHGSNLGQGENNALSLDTTFDVTVPQLDAKQATAHAGTNATFIQVGGQKINAVLADTTYAGQTLYFWANATQPGRQLSTGGEVLFHPDHQEIHLPDLQLSTETVVWRTEPGTEATINYGSNRVDVRDVTLVNGDQRLSANGVVGGAPGESLKVEATNLDVDQLNQLALGMAGEYQGRLNAAATIEGATSAPRVNGEFTLSQGGFRMFRFDSLGGTVSYAQTGIDLDVRLQQTAQQWLTAKGHAPMSLFKSSATDANAAAPPSEPVDIQVESSPIDLAVIQGFTTAVDKVSGTLQANFKVTGTGADPHLEGAVDVKNGGFELPDLGTTYTGLETRIDMTPDAVRIADLTIYDNHSNPLSIGGQLAVHGRDIGGVNIYLTAADFKVIDNETGELRLNTDMQVAGEVRAPRVRGTIYVSTGNLDVAEILKQVTSTAYSTTATELPTPDAESNAARVRSNADIPADADARRPGGSADTAPATREATQATANDATPATTPAPGTPVFDAIDLDITFGVPDDLVLKGEGIKASSGGVSLGDMNLTVGGDVNVVKKPGEALSLRGEIHTIRGIYTFQGRRFDLARDGRIRFIGTDEINPLLDLRATRVISGVEAVIHVQGTMREPQLTFSSTPPLEQADILSLIVFNQSVNELGEGEQVSLAQRAGDLAGGYLASGLARSIGNALNLNQFEISAVGENGTGPSVTVGQQVGRDLYFRVRQGFGGTQATEFILEYQIAKFLRAQATAAETSGGTQRVQFRRVERGGLDLIFFFAY